MHFAFICQIFQKIYFNVFLNCKNISSFRQHHSRVHILPCIVKMPCPVIRNHVISNLYITFEWGVKDRHEFFTYSLFIPSQSLHPHVPDKKEEGCWSLYKTFPKQLCQRFPKLSLDSVICYKTAGLRNHCTHNYDLLQQMDEKQWSKENGAWGKVWRKPDVSFQKISLSIEYTEETYWKNCLPVKSPEPKIPRLLLGGSSWWYTVIA